jgi:hypothetical protein
MPLSLGDATENGFKDVYVQHHPDNDQEKIDLKEPGEDRYQLASQLRSGIGFAPSNQCNCLKKVEGHD